VIANDPPFFFQKRLLADFRDEPADRDIFDILENLDFILSLSLRFIGNT